QDLIRPLPVLDVRCIAGNGATLGLRFERHDHGREAVDAVAACLAGSDALLLAERVCCLCGGSLREGELDRRVLAFTERLHRGGQVGEPEALRKIEAEPEVGVQERRAAEKAVAWVRAVYESVDLLVVVA